MAKGLFLFKVETNSVVNIFLGMCRNQSRHYFVKDKRENLIIAHNLLPAGNPHGSQTLSVGNTGHTDTGADITIFICYRLLKHTNIRMLCLVWFVTGKSEFYAWWISEFLPVKERQNICGRFMYLPLLWVGNYA